MHPLPHALLAFTLLHLVTAQQPVQLLFNVSGDDGPKDDTSRYFSLSTSSPISNNLRNSNTTTLTPIFKLIDALVAVVDDRVGKNNSIACNLRGATWARTSVDIVRARQLGQYVPACESRLDANDAVLRNELNSSILRDGMQQLAAAKITIAQAFKDVAPTLGKPSFDFSVRDWEIRREGQTCRLESAFAYRVNGQWFLEASATNSKVDAFQPEPMRQFIREFIPQDLNGALVTPQEAFLRAEPNGTIRGTGVIENSTTVLSTGAGKAGFSAVPMTFEENPALVEAHRLNELAISQAEDAITPSNIAILALPMAMSLIPVSFVADLSTPATIWYIVFTDVFSALPFLIKGVELMNSGSVQRSEMSSYHMGNETLGQIEIWAAECQGEEGFRVVGIVFVTIAVVAIWVGIMLEVFAYFVMKRRRAAGKQGSDEGPFGGLLFHDNAFSMHDRRIGRENDHERERELEWWQEGLASGVGASGLRMVDDHGRRLDEDGEPLPQQRGGPVRRWTRRQRRRVFS